MVVGKNEPKKGVVETLELSQPGEIEETELNDSELDEVSGGYLKKLPGKRKPPTLTLKRGKNQS